MKIMNLREAVSFLNAPPPEGLGMAVTIHWVRKMAEPDAEGRRRRPFFKHGEGSTAALFTTDESLPAHYGELARTSLSDVRGREVSLERRLNVAARINSSLAGRVNQRGMV